MNIKEYNEKINNIQKLIYEKAYEISEYKEKKWKKIRFCKEIDEKEIKEYYNVLAEKFIEKRKLELEINELKYEVSQLISKKYLTK